MTTTFKDDEDFEEWILTCADDYVEASHALGIDKAMYLCSDYAAICTWDWMTVVYPDVDRTDPETLTIHSDLTRYLAYRIRHFLADMRHLLDADAGGVTV